MRDVDETKRLSGKVGAGDRSVAGNRPGHCPAARARRDRPRGQLRRQCRRRRRRCRRDRGGRRSGYCGVVPVLAPLPDVSDQVIRSAPASIGVETDRRRVGEAVIGRCGLALGLRPARTVAVVLIVRLGAFPLSRPTGRCCRPDRGPRRQTPCRAAAVRSTALRRRPFHKRLGVVPRHQYDGMIIPLLEARILPAHVGHLGLKLPILERAGLSSLFRLGHVLARRGKAPELGSFTGSCRCNRVASA